MNIYSVRDTLLDYFMPAFMGPDDKAVLAALSQVINREGNQDAIAQAPHHFEVWKIGQIDEDGNVSPARTFVAAANALVRGNLRQGTRSGSNGDDREAAAPDGKRAAKPRGYDEPTGTFQPFTPTTLGPKEG